MRFSASRVSVIGRCSALLKVRYSPEDPQRTFQECAGDEAAACIHVFERRRSLNLLVQTSARQGEHKKPPATAASLSRSRAIISPRSRHLPPGLRFRRFTFPRNAERLHFREIPSDGDFVVRVNAIRHVSSASTRHFPRETCRTNCRRYDCCRGSSIIEGTTEVAALRSHSVQFRLYRNWPYFRSVTSVEFSNSSYTPCVIRRMSIFYSARHFFKLQRVASNRARSVVYTSRGRNCYPLHLLIVAMDTSASLTRNIPTKFSPATQGQYT